ncbi:PaaI family thioesterase [Eggerthella timonensis]|uniref:PaaI family thioesterase n=1 Tax=Eggerthella timonensis TaxID=1871008 RepID=UPI000C772B5F|nr:YiiD C-terminal domain-containing protein [Eggerthella timonensis]
MTEVDPQVRFEYTHGPCLYSNLAGIEPEVIEDRHIRLRMPLSFIHVNHVGVAYAGSLFVLAEVSAGALFTQVFGTGKFVPIIQSASIKYVAPGKSAMIVDVEVPEEEAAAKVKMIEERGRGRVPFNLTITDEDGTVLSEAEFVTYALPANANL